MNRNDISKIWLTDTEIWIELTDGRRAGEKFARYRGLSRASQTQLKNYTVSHFGIHWPELDEDLSFEGFFLHS